MKSNTNLNYERKASKKKIVFFLLIIIFIFGNISFYLKERAHWINDNHTNLKAKEYFILNNMVFFYRKMLNIFVEVDNPVMYPLNNLQEVIYNKGIKHLPKDDAEIAIWKYKFFLYFYVRKNYKPDKYLSNSKIISKKRVKILNDMYWAIETLATRPISDSEMNHMKYKIFPLIVSYYELSKGNYFGSKAGYYRIKALMQNKEHVQRIEKIINWLIIFKGEWNSDLILYKEIDKKHPEIIVAHYLALIGFIEVILDKAIQNKSLLCDNPYIDLYAKSRKEIYVDGKNSALFKLKNGQDKVLYQMIFQTQLTKILLYELHEKCGIAFSIEYPDKQFINEIIQPTPKPKN